MFRFVAFSVIASRLVGVAIHTKKVDSSVDCHGNASAFARNDKKAFLCKKDSKNCGRDLDFLPCGILGFCDDFVGFQGAGAGIYLSGNEQARAVESRKSAQKLNPFKVVSRWWLSLLLLLVSFASAWGRVFAVRAVAVAGAFSSCYSAYFLAF